MSTAGSDLPEKYIGNVVFNTVSKHPIDSINLPFTASILSVARRIRLSVSTVNDEYIRSALALIDAQGFPRAVVSSVDFWHGTDFLSPSCSNSGMWDAEFGGGKASYIGPASLLT
ncbi:hypothetical protein ACMFMF_004150 [Clarireedia jacksonii]